MFMGVPPFLRCYYILHIYNNFFGTSSSRGVVPTDFFNNSAFCQSIHDLNPVIIGLFISDNLSLLSNSLANSKTLCPLRTCYLATQNCVDEKGTVGLCTIGWSSVSRRSAWL